MDKARLCSRAANGSSNAVSFIWHQTFLISIESVFTGSIYSFPVMFRFKTKALHSKHLNFCHTNNNPSDEGYEDFMTEICPMLIPIWFILESVGLTVMLFAYTNGSRLFVIVWDKVSILIFVTSLPCMLRVGWGSIVALEMPSTSALGLWIFNLTYRYLAEILTLLVLETEAWLNWING